jgi:phosphoesterase RecJ-like protein
VPAQYAFLPGLDLLSPPASFPEKPALLVTFDTGSVDRLGALADRVAAAEHVLVIDHHATNTCFGTVNVIDRGAAATAVVVVELLDLMHCPLTAEIAAPVYTGLVTDTGSFKYAATTPSVHRLAARLLETGIPHDEISRQIWDTAPFGYVKLLGLVCARAVLEADEVGGLGLVWTAVGADDLNGYDLALSDVEGVIDVVRTTREAEVAAVLKTDPVDGLLKVSTRSKGAVDVGAVCASLGGGGHRFAAGFTSDASLPETLDRLRCALAETPHLAG